MKDLNKRIGILTALTLAFALLPGCGAQGGPAKGEASKGNYVLKFNHVLAESEPFHKGFLSWAERVRERTDGGLEIQVFHSAQLGVEEDIIEQLKQGVNVGQNTDSARLGMYVPEIAVMNAPYFVETIDEVVKLNELPSVRKWMEELETKHGIKVLSFNWIQGMRHMMANKPVRTPDDLKGLRIRTPGAPIWQESIRSLGATPVAMAFGDVFVGLEQGAIDGADLVYRNVMGAKLYEAAKYMSETKHILLINFEVISKRFFDSLPEEYRDILIEECDRAGLEASRSMEEEIKSIQEELAQKGMTIVKDVDIEAFKKEGEEAYEALKLTGVRNQIYKEMGKE